MKYTKKYSLNLAILIITSSLMLGCSGQDANDSQSLPSVNPIFDTPEGEVETTGFWVNLKNDFTFFSKVEGNWFEDCYIQAGSPSREMTCIMDINEGDMYMAELELQYNSPPGICDHVSVTAPWYWNHSSGRGPKAITIGLNKAGASPVLSTALIPTGGCEATPEDNTPVGCTAADEFKELTAAFEPKCIYDYSSDPRLPNCCYGEYTYTEIIDEDGDGGEDSRTVETKNWGGATIPLSCLGGVGATDWQFYNSEGYPSGKIQAVSKETDGLNDVIKIASNGETRQSLFSYQATYFESTGSPHNHAGYETVTTSNNPYAVTPIDDLDGSSIRSGNPTYVFSCLDQAFEPIHIITVHLREWNTLADHTAYGDTNGVTYNPDVVGTEGTDCISSGIPGGPCNDLLDFKDILDGVGGAYPTDNTVLNPNTIRSTYFPNIAL